MKPAVDDMGFTLFCVQVVPIHPCAIKQACPAAALWSSVSLRSKQLACCEVQRVMCCELVVLQQRMTLVRVLMKQV